MCYYTGMVALILIGILGFLFFGSRVGKIFMGAFCILLVYELMFGDPPAPKPTFSERRVARHIEKQEQLEKPNLLITALERAIADHNVSEIDRLYHAVVQGGLGLAGYWQSDHLVARDVDRVLRILKTCPIEIKNEQWGIDLMNHSRSQAQKLMAERRHHENKKELYRLKEEIRNNGG